jgi:hypothetical protein
VQGISTWPNIIFFVIVIFFFDKRKLNAFHS